MKMKTKKTKHCLLCKNKNIKEIFSLGNLFVSNFVKKRNIKKGLKAPLNLLYCNKCSLIQLSHIAPQEIMYKRFYWYRSGVTKTMNLGLKNIFEESLKHIKMNINDVVLDIGANDGTLLSYYKKKNFITIGCEPAKNLQRFLKKNCNFILNDFWSKKSLAKILTKNIFGVLDTISILAKQSTFNQPIHIIGNIQTPKILSYIKKNQLNDFITVHGFVSDNKKNQILQSVRMCIYIPFDEPFGLVPIESLSCGTPVVVSNLGGFTEVIKNGKTGIYVNPFNPQEVAEVISTYYIDLPRLNAMSKAGLELVQKNHLVKHFVDTFESYLEEMVSS